MVRFDLPRQRLLARSGRSARALGRWSALRMVRFDLLRQRLLARSGKSAQTRIGKWVRMVRFDLPRQRLFTCSGRSARGLVLRLPNCGDRWASAPTLPLRTNADSDFETQAAVTPVA